VRFCAHVCVVLDLGNGGFTCNLIRRSQIEGPVQRAASKIEGEKKGENVYTKQNESGVEVLLNVLPGLKGLGFTLFLLHEILPDVLEVLGLHDAQFAASLLQLPEGRLDLRLLPHEEPPHQEEQTQVLGLVEGPDDAVSASRAGAGGHVPGDQVAQGRVEGWHDGVEEGFLRVGGDMLVL
ncbi:hypothetical protein DBR06_SOUSAS1810174, partial [Sousa chinensis]